jgi:membrane protein implicated in regulation of membrane protease activity
VLNFAWLVLYLETTLVWALLVPLNITVPILMRRVFGRLRPASNELHRSRRQLLTGLQSRLSRGCST